MRSWYDEPTQVKFLDPDWVPYEGAIEEDRPMMSGICIHDMFICSCCGSLMRLSYYASLDLEGFEELEWIDLCEAIIDD